MAELKKCAEVKCGTLGVVVGVRGPKCWREVGLGGPRRGGEPNRTAANGSGWAE